MHPIPDKPTYRPDEVAEILGLSMRTVYRWCSNGKLPWIGEPRRIPREAIEDLQEKGRRIHAFHPQQTNLPAR